MKKVWFVFLFLIAVLLLNSQVNGEVSIIDGKKILKIWGSHYDRGYAHGYLLGDQVLQIAVDYFIGMFLLNDPTTYDYCRDYFEDHFQIEEKYYNLIKSRL